MKFEETTVFNFDGAIRGMRNPLESWNKSDSEWHTAIPNDYYEIGKNDLELMQKLIRAGSVHRKFMRQIFVSVDITAPLYWWKEFDTYKVGTVANSTSTMHKLASTPITRECFEMDDFEDVSYNDKGIDISTKNIWEAFCWDLEQIRLKYNETKDKRYWKELIRLLPESQTARGRCRRWRRPP